MYTCQTCGDTATQWDYDQLTYFCDRHVQQADFTVPLEECPAILRDDKSVPKSSE